jgi:hypothetical protein
MIFLPMLITFLLNITAKNRYPSASVISNDYTHEITVCILGCDAVKYDVITDGSVEYALATFGGEERHSSTLKKEPYMFLRNFSTDLTDNSASQYRRRQ